MTEEAHRHFGGYEEYLNPIEQLELVTDTDINTKNQKESSILTGSTSNCNSNNAKEFIASLNDEIIGNNIEYEGPFGKRPLIYTDWTASGRAVKHIEDYMNKKVLPYYGNTVSIPSCR